MEKNRENDYNCSEALEKAVMSFLWNYIRQTSLKWSNYNLILSQGMGKAFLQHFQP